jgi:vancomycin resistance protein VanJ
VILGDPKRKRRPWLRILSAANILGLLLLMLLNMFVAEASWFTMLLAYVPQVIFVIPSLALLVWAIFARDWRNSLALIGALSVATFALLGLRLHFSFSDSKHRLRVLTFNTEHAAKGIDNVIAVIREQDPDVFCLQECDANPKGPIIQRIKSSMPGYEVVGFGSLVTGSRLPVISSGPLPFPGPAHLPILEAVIEWNGSRIRIANVHLAAVFIDRYLIESPSRIPSHLREVGVKHDDQVSRLIEYSSGEEPLILCGDFNTPATGVLYRRLSGKLRDTFATTGNGFGYTIPAWFPLMRIDQIYTSPSLHPVAHWVSNHIASDHRAVVAEVVFE